MSRTFSESWESISSASLEKRDSNRWGMVYGCIGEFSRLMDQKLKPSDSNGELKAQQTFGAS